MWAKLRGKGWSFRQILAVVGVSCLFVMVVTFGLLISDAVSSLAWTDRASFLLLKLIDYLTWIGVGVLATNFSLAFGAKQGRMVAALLLVGGVAISVAVFYLLFALSLIR